MTRMIKRTITSPVFKVIKLYVECHKSELIGEDKLSDEDWKTL